MAYLEFVQTENATPTLTIRPNHELLSSTRIRSRSGAGDATAIRAPSNSRPFVV